MPDRAWRVTYLILAVGGAVGAAVLSHAPASPTQPSGRWLEAVILIAVSAFLFEPFFSGNGPAAANSVVAVLGAVSIGAGKAWIVAALLLTGALNLGVLVTAYVLDAPHQPPAERRRVAGVLSQIGTAVGSWRFLLIATLAVTLVVNNPPYGEPWFISAAVLAFILATTRVPPHEVVRKLRGSATVSIGGLAPSRLFPPHEVVLVGSEATSLLPGERVLLEGSGARSAGVVIGRTVFEGRGAVRVLVPEAMALVATNNISRVTASRIADGTSVTGAASGAAVERGAIYGTVGENSSINEIRVELASDKEVAVGDLLWTRRGENRVFWQVADASIARVSWGGDSHRAVVATAHQVGIWNTEKSAFDVDGRNPFPSDLVYGGQMDGPLVSAVAEGQAEIGRIPGSNFPVRVNVRELSLHHTAVLGVTGTGKTHLSFSLVDAFVNAGIKVICVDTTGQYGKRFKGEDVRHVEYGDTTKAFLDSEEKLAIYRPTPKFNTISEGNRLASNVFDWAKAQPDLEEGAPARLVIMFEEAQNFVPETFVVDEWSLKAASQSTSRIIMESRKFGLGFVLVSQRTAMVTKSALSQCNTVFAFQAFDQTGLDYLEGICGTALAKGIPGLPQQTAVIMGRGLTSARPVIVRVADAPVIVR